MHLLTRTPYKTHVLEEACLREHRFHKNHKNVALWSRFFFLFSFHRAVWKVDGNKNVKKKQHNMKSRPCRARAIQEREIKERSKGLRHAPFFISSLVLGTSDVLVIGLLRAQTVLWDSSCSQSLGACCSSSEPSRSLSIAWAESWILP